MYINRAYLKSKNLGTFDWFLLYLIMLNTSEDMSEELIQHLPEEILEEYDTYGYIRTVKKKKVSAHVYTTLRLTKAGKEVFRNAQILGYTEKDEALFNYLTRVYKEVEKPLGNDIKVKQLLAWFRVETEYTRQMIYKAIKFYVDIAIEDGKTKYIPTLENLLWKPQNVFKTKWDLADSKLYQFINENKDELNGNTSN